jgi:hypothetical protein
MTDHVHAHAAHSCCSAGCGTKFLAGPERYLAPKDAAPETIALDSDPNPEVADMTRRFWIGRALTLPVFALETGGHLTGFTY